MKKLLFKKPFLKKILLGGGAFLIPTLAPIFTYAQNVKTLDDFENITSWEAAASDGVTSKKSSVKGVNGKAIRFDYDFNNHGGYAFVRKKLPVDYPENYVISFYIRGKGLKNTLEFKLSDRAGDTVWWNQKRDFVLTDEWQLIRIKKRQVSFAWGPVKDTPLTHSEGLEFVITAGNGGNGYVEIDNLQIEPLEPESNNPPPIKAIGAGSQIIDNNLQTAFDFTANQAVTLDLGRVREFGGLKLEWGNTNNISYQIQSSIDGKNYKNLETVRNSDGGTDLIKTTEAEAKFLKIVTQNAASLKEVYIEPLAFGENYNSFIGNIAANTISGSYPRAFYNQQEYWTLTGVDGGGNQGALISEDGAIEIGRGGFSIAPFVIDDNKLFTWQDVKISHSLRDDYLPIPSTNWDNDDFKLKTTAFVSGTNDNSFVHGIYELTNEGKTEKTFKLALLTRPTQVNSPKQFLSTEGGYSPINSVTLNNDAALINDISVNYSAPANQIVAGDYYGGNLVEKLKNNNLPNNVDAADKNGLAQGLMIYEIKLKPNETKVISFNASLNKNEISRPANDLVELQKVTDFWRNRLANVDIKINSKDGQEIANAVKTSIAYILIMRDGAILRPGARSYARSWIRDGVMIAEELLRYGYTQEAIDYLDWYSKYQFDNGKIPCCVDFRGADPVPENDSQGEYIHLVKLVYDYTKDPEIAKKYWPNVKAAYDYMNNQRLSERTDTNHGTEKYGLLPPSISHEGYSDKPAYSHWDNFWGLKGYEDAQIIAHAAGFPDKQQEIYRDTQEFANDIKNSIALTQKKYGFNYITGAADRGDFDATSTTIALLLGVDKHFPREWFNNTFDKYWDNFVIRRDSDKEWNDYTPYEWRNVSAMTHLNNANRADEITKFFMNDRRPHEWNAFAEVVGRDVRKPRFLGDLPHGWVASDFIRAALDRIVFENTLNNSVMIGAGVNQDWLLGDGITLNNIHTSAGIINIGIKAQSKRVDVNIKFKDQTKDKFPAGGFIISKNLFANKVLYINGKKYNTTDKDLYYGANNIISKPN